MRMKSVLIAFWKASRPGALRMLRCSTRKSAVFFSTLANLPGAPGAPSHCGPACWLNGTKSYSFMSAVATAGVTPASLATMAAASSGFCCHMASARSYALRKPTTASGYCCANAVRTTIRSAMT